MADINLSIFGEGGNLRKRTHIDSFIDGASSLLLCWQELQSVASFKPSTRERMQSDSGEWHSRLPECGEARALITKVLI